MALEHRVSGWDRFLVRPYRLVTDAYGTVHKVPVRGWELVTGERLAEMQALLQHRNPAPIAA